MAEVGLLGKYFTIELQRALIRADKKPILILGSIEDVYERDGQFFLQAYTCLRETLTEIRFDLLCNDKTVSKVLAMDRQFLGAPPAAIVAQVTSVRRPVLALEPLGSEWTSGTVSFSSSDSFFLATGKCLAFSGLPENFRLD